MSCKTDNSFHFVNFVINIRLCLYLKENLHKNWSCVIISFHCITNSGSGTAYHSWTPEFTPFFMFHVPRSWIFLWCCADHCLFVLFLFLIHVCIVCLSSIYSFWLTLWELPAFFSRNIRIQTWLLNLTGSTQTIFETQNNIVQTWTPIKKQNNKLQTW